MSGPADSDHADQRVGVIAGLVAYTLWGVFPIYFKLVELVLYFRRQWPEVRTAVRQASTMFWLACAAVCISANWLIYIWAIHNDRILETSLGYFINPLVYVAVGVFAFGETLSRLQLVSVLLAAVGVSYMTFVGGVFPWVAISLAALFTAYGVIRKQVAVGAMPGLFVETSLLFPLGLAYLAWLMLAGEAALGAQSLSFDLLLILAGPITVVPLWMFAIAARKLTLTIVGFMQFIGPSLQFLTGLYYGETLTTADLVAFSCIWLAIALFIADATRKRPKVATIS